MQGRPPVSVGSWLDMQRFQGRYSLEDWVLEWSSAVLEKGSVDRVHLHAGLGKLAFVCGALVFDRPRSKHVSLSSGKS